MINSNYFRPYNSVLFTIYKRLNRLPSVVIFTLCIIISIFYSLLLGILISTAYIIGIYLSITALPLLPHLLSNQFSIPSASTSGCTVCGDSSCRRQRPSGEHQPWIGLEIPKETDQALQDLFNKLLNEFIATWYSQVTKDDSFLWEIRVRLRFACAVLLRRIQQTDLGELICERLLPIFLRHADDFFVAADGCRTSAEKVATVVAHLGDRLHPAARSRNSELDYLRAISRTLCRLGLNKPELECKAVFHLLVELLAGWLLLTLSDTLCSPHNINTLLWLALSSGKLQPMDIADAPKVQFLKTFATRPVISRNSPLHVDLNAVLSQQKLLYRFMQYLKKCGAVNLLQFCLDVENFNRRLLVPELPPSASAELYKEAWDLYSLYLKPDSPDAIPCTSALSHQMFQVLSRGGDDITRLQKSTPLFQAFEDTFSLLEHTYLSGFYQSEDFFQFVCDESQPVGPVRMQHRKGSEPLVSKISQKLQRLVTGQTVVDGCGYYVETACDAGDLDCDDVLGMSGDFSFRDMTDWRVTIPEAVIEQDPNSRPYPVFVIRVVTEGDLESWEVRRKFNDFYTLQSKLLEFHQRLVEELPAKKGVFSPRGTEYLENWRQRLEEYLQRIIRQQELRCSDLLHCFLRSPAEFQVALRVPLSFTGVLKRSVEPMKLKKDRGRHLESFLNAFQASVEPSGKRQSSQTAPENVKRNLTGGLFGDNLAAVLKTTSTWPPSPPKPILRLSTFWDCLIYWLWRIVGGSSILQRLILVVKSVLGDAASPLVHSYIHRRILDVLLPRLPYLTRLLQNAILSPSKPDDVTSAAMMHAQVEEALLRMSKSAIFRILTPNLGEGMKSLLETLQHPALNKHLFYCLFDEVLRILFSEFSVPSTAQL